MIKLVSADSLRKTGIFAENAGDFPQFPPQVRQSGGPETESNGAKSRDFRPILALLGKPGRTPDWLAEAGGFELRYGELETDALACPRGAAESHCLETHRSFETLEFREPYRIRGVQSLGDKGVFRRIMSASCREGVRSSNEKLLRYWRLIAHKRTRRICGFGQGGGGRGTGFEPSPRRPTWPKVT